MGTVRCTQWVRKVSRFWRDRDRLSINKGKALTRGGIRFGKTKTAFGQTIAGFADQKKSELVQHLIKKKHERRVGKGK